LALAGALWLPWFHRQLSGVFAPVPADRSLSGWESLGGAGAVVLALGVVAMGWGVFGAVPRLAGAPQASAFWLVAAGGLALVIEIGATVGRVGAQEAGGEVLTTTSPSVGLAVALGGAAVMVLAGMTALVGDARRAARSG
jgi:hypothetical protein